VYHTPAAKPVSSMSTSSNAHAQHLQRTQQLQQHRASVSPNLSVADRFTPVVTASSVYTVAEQEQSSSSSAVVSSGVASSGDAGVRGIVLGSAVLSFL
jgi:hypothetical protein